MARLWSGYVVVLIARGELPPAESRANFRFLSGGTRAHLVEIAHSRQYLIELRRSLDGGLNHPLQCRQVGTALAVLPRR
jgi:hypothetical protein